MTAKTTFSSRIFRYIVPWTAILFLAVSLLFFYYQSVVFINEKASDIEVIIEDRADDFEQQFRAIKAEIAYVSRFDSVRDALLHYPGMTSVDRYRNSNQISADLTGINLFNQYIEDIIIIGTNGFYKNLDSYGRLKSGIEPLSWDSITQYKAGNSRFYFTLPYTADYYTTSPHMVFSVVLPVLENNAVIGYIQGNLNYERVTGMLEKANRAQSVGGTSFGAITEDGRIVFSESGEEVGRKAGGRIAEGVSDDRGRFDIREGKRQLVVYRKLSESGWIFLGVIDYRAMIAPVFREAFILMVFVLPLSVALMSVVIYYLAKRIQRPMESLKNRVENVDIETYRPSEASYEISEVQIVADRFEESMQRNQNLIRHVYEEELLRKDAELEVLRNQITPHFIYNSLQLIKAEAVMEGSREISRSVNALASLLRYSMDSGTDTVKLKEEAAYIGDYLEIYKKRYVDRFTYEIVQNANGEALIPKMILQPLAENSIRHGFAEVRTGGRIFVRITEEAGMIVIRIEDNGCGAPEEQLRKLRQEIRDSSELTAPGRSIGILNVHSRIRLQCGEGSGISEIGNREEGGFYQVLRIEPIRAEEERQTELTEL